MNIRIHLSHFVWGYILRIFGCVERAAVDGTICEYFVYWINLFVCSKVHRICIFSGTRENRIERTTQWNRWKPLKKLPAVAHTHSVVVSDAPPIVSLSLPSLLPRRYFDLKIYWLEFSVNEVNYGAKLSAVHEWLERSTIRRFGWLLSINTFDCVPRSTWSAFVASPLT